MVGLEGESRVEGSFGRYRTVLPLGQGGTADVHLAVAEGPAGFRKLVVLKVLKRTLSHDPELREMFLREARLAARLQHPNIVQTYEVLDQGRAPVIVMEYLDGQPLSQLIVRGREVGFTLPLQLRVLIDALGGLHAAHQLRDFDGTPLGVVHRDVSPHNLFVTVEGQSKVLDFGIAKLDRSIVETEVGAIKGKIRYMAPEQLRGETLDRRADLYAAGVILWEALVGERMWKGVDENEIRARVSAGDLPRPPSLRTDTPATLDRICHRALAHDPRARPATALALADELEAALADLPGGAPSARQVGLLVGRLFESTRAQTQAAIEERIGQMAVEELGTTVELSPVGPGASRASQRAIGNSRVTAPTSRNARVAAAAVLFVLAATALLAAAKFRSTGPRAADVASDDARGNAGAAEAFARAPEPSSPPALSPSPSSVASARGAQPHARPMGKRLARPAALAVPASPAPDCAHPFFVDADGIKKFRPECR
jgi:tRNA A-37 threonylcarbamoyl transferase component Bud32